MKKILLSLVALLCAIVSNAQIGYQVSLLNTATGEPRSGETVSCVIELTNSEGTVICSETKSATSNDFGVISLSVGNANTFDNMDWSKLPLFISVTIDGKLVGQSQVLSVPVAEYAKKTGVLTYENIGEKKTLGYSSGGCKQIWTFSGHIVKLVQQWTSYAETFNGTCYIDGNAVFGFVSETRYGDTQEVPFVGHYSPESDTIYLNNYDN